MHMYYYFDIFVLKFCFQTSSALDDVQFLSCFPDCGVLPVVTNGTVDQSGGTLYMDTSRFTCDLGFNLQGTSVRTCGPDGTWDSAQPTCEIAGTIVTFAVGIVCCI